MRRAMRVRLRSSQRSSSAAAKVTRMRFCNVRPDICNVRHCCMCLGGLPPPLRGGNFFFFFLGPLQNRGPFYRIDARPSFLRSQARLKWSLRQP